MIKVTDPRVRRRCEKALQFTLSQVPVGTPARISTRAIDQSFGQQQNPLSKQLRQLLLTNTDGHYNMQLGKCKQYVRNEEGCKLLQNLLDPNTDYIISAQQHIADYVNKFSEELTTGQFNYKDKSNRHWHPLQNLPSETRKRELSKYGYCHIYDIRCAAPSIILHLAKDLGLNIANTNAIDYYIQNRKQIRDQLAYELQLPVNDVKRLVNMLFNGAPVGHCSTYATTQILRGDNKAINAVKSHPFLTELRNDIRKCWKRIALHKIDGEYVLPRQYHADGRKKRITSKDRWSLYFSYERYVMDSVRSYLDKQLALYLIEHDGWSCNIQVDINELTHHVRSATGIETIEFDYEYYNNHPVLRTR